ncbi:MAG: hypothetical protein Q8S10_09940 [Thiobacillus sp.]|nr:hypothetical protein [Thiobacillus sp.]
MKSTTTQLRRTAVSIATALAVVVPGLASAALVDRAKARVQTAQTNASTFVNKVQENRPLEKAKDSATEIFQNVQEMQVLEQFKESVQLIKHMQAHYQHFSGGRGCGATCSDFRRSLKNTFDNFASLAGDVPALSRNTQLIYNLQRTSNLVDYIPSRALYVMWQTMSAKTTEFESMSGEIRQILDSLPPLADPASFSPNPAHDAAAAQSTAGSGNGGLCAWVRQEDKPKIELLQARLEWMGWALEKVEGMIPDIETKAETGASAGAAVANGTASLGASIKPTDSLKIGLKALATVPQSINWAIKINMLRAKVACPAA